MNKSNQQIKTQQIKPKIEEKKSLKELINEHQLNNFLELAQLKSEIAKKNHLPTPNFAFLSELSEVAQKRLNEIINRSQNKNHLQLENPKSLIEKLSNYDDLENQVKLMKYIKRVNETAANKLLEDENFAKKFIENETFDAVILSVDIRRSTELMLKCSSAKNYAKFITLIASEFETAVKNRFGVYDKFTGDGFLAFFPDFYSGDEALINAVLCVADCKEIFDTVFAEYKNEFDLGNTITGIGAGIDLGQVYAEGGDVEYSVVGKPVVYACRFSSAPANHVYLTENAKTFMDKINCGRFSLSETFIPIKHENNMKAFDICLDDFDANKISAKEPSWVE